MKLSTFKKRTANIAKASNGYKNALMLMTTGDRVYTCHTSGSGRFTTNIDRTEETIEALVVAGLTKDTDFIHDNNSPRGGKAGNYVELTKVGKRKLIK